jgi:hypothetical protein
MRLSFAPLAALGAFALCPRVSPLLAQSPAEHESHPASQVIFSRSIDENGEVTTHTGPGAAPAQATIVKTPVATDAEREAVKFTGFDLNVHLNPVAGQIAVRAQLEVLNDGKAPLEHIPLQISSSLDWDRIRIGGRDVAFEVATVNSDVDHTGQLHEASVRLAQPLDPGRTLALDVTYSGAIEPSARRLRALGVPADVALRSDWDQIGDEFTGLRGFGNVVWYPVSSVPAVLGSSPEAATINWQQAAGANVDSARVFDEIGQHKLSLEGARFRLRLSEEFTAGLTPTVALINGRPVPLTVTRGSEDVAGVATAELAQSRLGFEAPSLFVAVRKPVVADHVTLWAVDTDEPIVQQWSPAATEVAPWVASWLGPDSGARLTILELPDPKDVPAETGSLLVTPIRQVSHDEVDTLMVHGLAHAFLDSQQAPGPAWLDEGAAYFLSTLWLEKEQGRPKALELLESSRQALALAEPSSPGESSGEPLCQAFSPVYYRTKAAYVFWMLRDLASDAAIAGALRAWEIDPNRAREEAKGEFESLLEKSAHRDLGWFFADWVDADKGLPDVAIERVFPAPAQAGNTLVGVNLSNSGYVAAEVPVTVRTAGTAVTQRVLVPARGNVVERILIQGAPTEVQANDGTVPETQATVHLTRLTETAGSDASSVPQ